MAAAHGVTAEKSDWEFMANKFGELAGDEPVDEEIDTLCINLGLEGVLTPKQSIDLLNRYLLEDPDQTNG